MWAPGCEGAESRTGCEPGEPWPTFLRLCTSSDKGNPGHGPQQGGRLPPWDAQAHQLGKLGSRLGNRVGSEASHAPTPGYLARLPLDTPPPPTRRAPEAQTWLGAGNQAEATLGTGVPAEPGARHPVSPTNATIRSKDCTPTATGPRHRAREMRQVPTVPYAASQGWHKEDGEHLVNDSHVGTHGHEALNNNTDFTCFLLLLLFHGY